MGRNILVVEDDKNISDLIHMYLVKEGFDVRIAGDGGKALEEFQKKEPDLILLDIMLPKIDGFGVCEVIRRSSRLSTAVKPVFRLLSIRYGCSLRLTSTDMPGRRPSTAGSGLAFSSKVRKS